MTESTRPRKVRVDLHLHSDASIDCSADVSDLAQRCSTLGFAPIFVTDHDSIEGAIRLRERTLADVVVGQEVSTLDGDLIGLFLDSRIEPGLPSEETVSRIKIQGGIVYLPHPFDTARRSIAPEVIDRILDFIDIVEVVNGRSSAAANKSAEQLCSSLGCVRGAGSDAHCTNELGSVYIEMEEFSGSADFLRKLDRGRIVAGSSRLRLSVEARLRRLTGTGRAMPARR